MKKQNPPTSISNIHMNIYNDMLKEILNLLCKPLSETIKLAIVVCIDGDESIYPDHLNIKSILSQKNWQKDFLFKNIKMRIICYAGDDYSSQMGNSLYENKTYPVFDLFMERILNDLTKTISGDLTEGCMTSYWEADYIPVQSVIDFLDCKDLPLDINVLTYISSLSYETAPCTGKIVFIDDDNNIKKMIHCSRPILQFKEAIYFKRENSRTIRKLLETTKNNTYLLASKFSNSMAITGIAYDIENERLLKNNYILEFGGHMHWCMKYNRMTAFEYKNGCYYIADDFNQAKNYLKSLYTHYQDSETKQKNIQLAKTLISEAYQQEHGALIIISSHASDEAERLCTKKRGIRIAPPYDILENKDMICPVTSIDGAILLDETFKCHAIGVIVDGIAADGDVSRGSRYNSALTYIKWLHDTYNYSAWAIIISEDRMINIIES